MTDHIHTWYSVRAADGKHDFETRCRAEAFANGLDVDWTLVRVEVTALESTEPHGEVNVRNWTVGGSGTLPPAADSFGWSARSGDQEARSG